MYNLANTMGNTIFISASKEQIQVELMDREVDESRKTFKHYDGIRFWEQATSIIMF